MPPQQPATLQPIVRIPLHTNRDGSMFEPVVDVDDATGTVYVCQIVDRNSAADLALWYAPDAALALIVLIPAVYTRHAYRVCTRPQRPGQPHCRKCNYELHTSQPTSAQTAQAPALCPECAAPATRPVIGRTLVERVAGPTLLTLLVVALALATLTLTLEKPTWPGSRLWPAPVVSQLVPTLAVRKLDRNNATIQRVTRWRLPTPGHALATAGQGLAISDPFVHSTDLAPRGDFFLACTSFPNPVYTAARLITINTATGDRRETLFSIPGCNITPSLRGYTPDGTCAYVQLQTWNALAPALTCDTVLARFDLTTGARTDIVTVQTPLLNVPNTMQVPQQYYAVKEDPGQPLRWALYTHTTPAATTLQGGEVALPDGHGAISRFSVTFSGTSFYEPTLSEDAAALLMDLYGTPSPTTLTFDLKTGAFQEVPCTRTLGVPDTRARGLALRTPAAAATTPAAATIVMDEGTGKTIATLAGRTSYAGARFSNHGRYAFGTEVSSPALTGLRRFSPFNQTVGTLYIWDVSSLTAQGTQGESPSQHP